MLTTQHIEDLITRCKFAQAHKIPIALAEEYARELGYVGELPPKMKEFSPAHLLYLISKLGSTPPDPGGPTSSTRAMKRAMRLGSTPPDPGGPVTVPKVGP